MAPHCDPVCYAHLLSAIGALTRTGVSEGNVKNRQGNAGQVGDRRMCRAGFVGSVGLVRNAGTEASASGVDDERYGGMEAGDSVGDNCGVLESKRGRWRRHARLFGQLHTTVLVQRGGARGANLRRDGRWLVAVQLYRGPGRRDCRCDRRYRSGRSGQRRRCRGGKDRRSSL